MSFVLSFFIILIMCFLGEVLNAVLPFPVPASIYGLIIMLVCLMSGIVKLKQVEKTADFLLSIMPIMFIPAGVGVMNVWGSVKNILLPVIIIIVISTILVLFVSGKLTQLLIKTDQGDNGDNNERNNK